jgi:catechol 2,3-dioxygenase-like lactoylglutathione lyase family enzyme
MMQSWSRLVPELLVADIETSLRFWRDLLGFSIAYDRPSEGFAFLDLDDVQFMLEQRDEKARQWWTAALEPPLGRGINFQIQVDSIGPILTRLEQAGWPLFMAPEEKWYRAGAIETGQLQFLVQDPDGYLLRLIQHIGYRPRAV